MDARHFDALTRVLSAPDSRRRLLALLATLPLLGGALALFAPEDAAAKERRRRRKQRHKRRKNPGGRKRKGCRPKSATSVCAGRCGTVKSRQTCGKTVDCGSCDCTPACDECFTCQGNAGAPGTCVPQAAGTPCGDATTCDGDMRQPGDSCNGSGVCVAASPVSCAPGACWDGACVCGDVCASGCQFTSVQDAIDTLPAGSTVRICAGTFGAIAIDKDLTLIGVGDGADTASNTILDGEDNGSVVTVTVGVTVSLQGLRITGGSAPNGAGVDNFGALTMTGCTVTGNTGSSGGGGIYSNGPSLTMTNCAITSNTGQDYGGGMFTYLTVLTMTDCDISGNGVTGNAGGLHLEAGEATLTRCTVTGNTATGYAGGIHDATGHLTLDDSHVTNNLASSDGGVLIRGDLGATISILGDTTICANDVPQCTGFASSACQDTCP